MNFEMHSLQEGYADLADAILTKGHETSPRGERTIEVLGASLTCHDPMASLPVGTGRKVIPALGAVESLQLIGGFHDPKALVAVAPHFENYLGEDGRQRAPYGPRLASQIPIAIERLKQDPDSRQAQVTIWDPRLDNAHGLHDYPCTTSLQWLIRDGQLHMQVHMRSNDFWLGLPYDAFQFTQAQLTIAEILGVEPGAYRHSAASLHIYEKHWDLADGLHFPEVEHPDTTGVLASSWQEAAQRAAKIHDLGELPEAPGAGEEWLLDRTTRLRG
jgi:thymidylate synthase